MHVCLLAPDFEVTGWTILRVVRPKCLNGLFIVAGIIGPETGSLTPLPRARFVPALLQSKKLKQSLPLSQLETLVGGGDLVGREKFDATSPIHLTSIRKTL